MIYKLIKLNRRAIYKQKKNENMTECLLRSLAAQFIKADAKETDGTITTEYFIAVGKDDFKKLSDKCERWYQHFQWTEEQEREFINLFMKKNPDAKGVKFVLLDIGPCYSDPCQCGASI